MGFTPWPYEATIEAVGDTYNKIQSHGDFINHHIDGGVPWPEAYAGNASYGTNLEGDISLRLSNSKENVDICLSVCPLNTQRDAPSDYWGETGTNMARTAPWDSYDFGDAELVTAYTGFLLNLIDRFKPKYCNYGIEATEYITKHSGDTAKGDALFTFLQQVYDNIKAVHPDLTLFISVTLKSPGSAEALLVQSYSDKISSCTDLIGVSTYGYVFYGHAGSGDPAKLPSDWLSQANNYAPGKPLAVTETCWIAEDLVIPAYSLNTTGTPGWQSDYAEILLNEADRLDAVFVTWFSVVDFDALWNDTLGQDPLAQIWRDTGLFDESLQSRPALDVWDSWLGRPVN